LEGDHALKIAITGANEFLGSFLCEYFYSAGHEVIAVGKQKLPPPDLKFSAYQQTDLLNPFPAFDADACIHAATYHSETAAYPELFLHHVEGTLNVVEAAKHCSHLVFISSSSVYEFGIHPVKETDARIEAKLSDYGETKLLAEEVLSYEIPASQKRLILRPRVIYGIGDNFFLPKLFDLVKDGTIFSPVDKNIKTSLTHIENIAYAIGLFFRQKEAESLQIYNVADESVYLLTDTIREILSAIEDHPLHVVHVPLKPLSAIDKLYSKLHFIKKLHPAILDAIHQNSVLDLHCIQKGLHYKPGRNFQNSVAEIAGWIKSMGGKKAYLQQLSAS